jgi:membrane carboxypeptidase/penicillin-binding protein
MLQGFIGATHTPKGTAYYTFQQDSHVPSSYVIAGKTGTATTATSSATRAPNAWFVGFGPVGAATQYVVVVEVAQGGYGEAAAAPAVANIFNYLYANPPPASLGIPTSRNQPSTTLPPANPPAGTPTTTGPTTTGPTTTATASSGVTATTVPPSAGTTGTPTSPATTSTGTTPAGGAAPGTAGNAPLAGAAAGSRTGSGAAAPAAVAGFPRGPP